MYLVNGIGFLARNFFQHHRLSLVVPCVFDYLPVSRDRSLKLHQTHPYGYHRWDPTNLIQVVPSSFKEGVVG